MSVQYSGGGTGAPVLYVVPHKCSLASGCVRLRSYLGYPPVRDAQPNTTHFALAALQYSSVVNKLVTQNVDGLHHKAIAHVWGENLMQERILELHGRLRVSILYYTVKGEKP